MRLPSAPDPEFGEEIVAVRIAQICTGSRKTVEYLVEGLGRRRGTIPFGLAEMGQFWTTGTGVYSRGPRTPGDGWSVGRTPRPIRNLGLSAPAIPQIDSRRVWLSWPATICRGTASSGTDTATMDGSCPRVCGGRDAVRR